VLFIPSVYSGVVYIDDDFSFTLIGEYEIYYLSPAVDTITAQLNVTGHGIVRFLLFDKLLFEFNDTVADTAIYTFDVSEYTASETRILDVFPYQNYTIVLWKNSGDDIHPTTGHLLVMDYNEASTSTTTITMTTTSSTVTESVVTNYTLPYIPIVTWLPRQSSALFGPEAGIYAGIALIVLGIILMKYEG